MAWTMTQTVWMSHGDRTSVSAEGFVTTAVTDNAPYAAIADPARRIYGVQFHPEVQHTEHGTAMLRNFVLSICDAARNWTPEHFIAASVQSIREQVGAGRVLLGMSGGVDSSVAGELIHRAVGDQLVPCSSITGCCATTKPDAGHHAGDDIRLAEHDRRGRDRGISRRAARGDRSRSQSA